MRSQVRLHVARLLVDLPTWRVGAVVDHLAQAPPLPPHHQVGRARDDRAGRLAVQPGHLRVVQHLGRAVLVGWVVLGVVLGVG